MTKTNGGTGHATPAAPPLDPPMDSVVRDIAFDVLHRCMTIVHGHHHNQPIMKDLRDLKKRMEEAL